MISKSFFFPYIGYRIEKKYLPLSPSLWIFQGAIEEKFQSSGNVAVSSGHCGGESDVSPCFCPGLVL